MVIVSDIHLGSLVLLLLVVTLASLLLEWAALLQHDDAGVPQLTWPAVTRVTLATRVMCYTCHTCNLSHLSDTCHVSPHLLPLPLTTPMHFFHLKQERPQLLGRLASVEVRARPSRRRQADTEDRRMVASEVCNTARPLYRIDISCNVQTVLSCRDGLL